MDLNFLNKMFATHTCSESLIDMQLSYENLLTLSGKLYQKEIIFNEFLPYADKTNKEADLLLQAIKANLGRCVMERNIYPACLYWTKILTKYLMLYGLRFTKSEHISLIKLMYQLVTIPNLDTCLVNNFAKLLIHLLKKKELISPEELELPWRQLYEICNKFLLNNLKPYSYFSRCPEEYRETLHNLVFTSKIYFPVSATSEILSELKPKICPYDKESMNVTMKLVSWFLPVELPEKHRGVSHSMWLADFMQIWESFNNAPEWEADFMSLLSHLAANNIGIIEWSPHIPLMFTRFIRTFNLPVHYKNVAYKNKHKLNMIDAARWTASVIGCYKDCSIHLAALLNAITPYLFPPIGESTMRMKKYIFFTIKFFLLRLRKERHGVETWQEETIEEFKLTEADIDEFVRIMLPPILSSLNSGQSFVETQMSLKYLALLRPNVVIPKVLEIFYPNVGQSIEKYKLFVGMSSLESVSRPLVMGSRHVYSEYGFSNGPRVVIPLLFAALEAIDLNEGLSCWAAVSMLRHLVSMITLADSSRGSLPREGSELERQVCEDTAHLEEFVLLFLDKIFELIAASSVESTRLEYQSTTGILKTTVESMMEENLFNVATVLLRQCSRSIFISALNKLTSYVLRNYLESRLAGNLLAIVCRVFAQTDGHLVVSKLLPQLLQKLDDLLADEGPEILQEEELSDELSYILLVLQAIFTTQGNHLLPYVSDIIQILDRLMKCKSYEGQRLTNQLLGNVLASLCTVQCVKVKKNFDDDNVDQDYAYWNHWGESVDLTSAQIHWYVPGRLENEAAQLIFTRYLEPSLRFIQDCLKSRNLSSRDNLRRSLRIVLKLLEGCDFALPMPKTEVIAKPDISEFYFEPTLGNEYEIQMPNGQNVRESMVKILSTLQKLILDIGEDDTISLELLQEIWKLLAKDKSADKINLNLAKSAYHSIKLTAENCMVGDKGYLPEVLLERMTILQILRKMNATYSFTETSKEIMLNLFKLATSKYLNVRLLAQEALKNFLDEYQSAHQALLPHILEILENDADVHESAFKGALYVIHFNKEHSFLGKNDWYILTSLLPALVRSKHSENLTIIRLLERMVEYSQTFLIPININIEIADTCVEAATQLWLNGIKPSCDPANEHEINTGIEDLKRVGEINQKMLNAALDRLIDAAQDINDLHWRRRRLAVRFILALIHPENSFSAKIVEYFLKGLISDSIDERKSSLTVMMYVFKLIKRNALKQLKRTTERELDWTPGIKQDECTLYGEIGNDLPYDKKRWEKTQFLDEPYLGYLMWPEKYTFYAPPSRQQLEGEMECPATEQERVIGGFFNDNANMKKLVKFLSLEENKGSDKFKEERYHLFRGLFRLFGKVHLDNLLGYINDLVDDTEEKESKQRCAAEILCGLICGSKHWSFSAVEAMWLGMRPIFRKVLHNVTEETIDNWRTCLREMFRKRDPRRLHPLLEFLAEESFSDVIQSSFHDSARLMLLTSAMKTGHRWRLVRLFDRLMPRIEARLLNEPYDNVRTCLVELLIVAFDSGTRYSGYSLEKDLSKLSLVLHPENEKIEVFVGKAMQRLASFQDPKTLSAICHWVIAYESSMHYGLVSGMYLLFPVLSHAENSESNPELADECRRAVAALAQMFVLPKHVPAALSAFETASNSLSCFVRASAAEFFRLFLSRNMPLLVTCNNWINKFRDITLLLLEDPQQEVRERASLLLNTMLLCGILCDATNYLDLFGQLAKTKLRGNLTNQDINNALRFRHAGVLGLCAFVQAHPHDIPKFVPFIFEQLSLNLEDPHPIPATIRKTVSEFKRTHCDGWTGLQGIAVHFTEKQFSILQDLTVPPTHYA